MNELRAGNDCEATHPGESSMNRGKLDIVASILDITKEDALRDHIRRKCNLSSEQFNEYVEILLENGLIDAFPAVNMRHMPGRQNKRRTIFHIAQTGKQFLKLYSELYALVDRDATILEKDNLSPHGNLLPSAKKVGAFLHRQGR